MDQATPMSKFEVRLVFAKQKRHEHQQKRANAALDRNDRSRVTSHCGFAVASLCAGGSTESLLFMPVVVNVVAVPSFSPSDCRAHSFVKMCLRQLGQIS